VIILLRGEALREGCGAEEIKGIWVYRNLMVLLEVFFNGVDIL
jgi:hypothetical protein